MQADKPSEVFLKITTEINTLLLKHGFERQPEDIIDDYKNLKRWIRNSKWKQEIVDLSFPTKHLDCIAGVGIHLRINLPYQKDEAAPGVFDGISVSHFLGYPNSSYTPPRIFGNFRSSGFIKRLALDTEKALAWFDSYATPAMCLKRLESEETSLGLIKANGAAKLAYEYLRSKLNSGAS